MSSFLARVKSQFSSSSSSTKKPSSSSSTPPPPSSTSIIKASPSFTFTRQGTISRKPPPLSSSTSSSKLNGSPAPKLQLHLDDEGGGGLGSLPEGGTLGEDDASSALREKEIDVLGRSSWTSEQVAEFVALAGKKMKERDMSLPGLFLPHRLPSSLVNQQTLVLLFLRVHQPNIFPPAAPTSSLTLTPPTPAYLFETELKYSSSVHDLASSIRFAIRRLSPSKERTEWYQSFATWEVERNFEPNVWVQIGGMNEEVRKLMVVVEELLMTVAALVDRTGVSAAKLTRLLGFWILRDGTEIRGDDGEVLDVLRVFETLGRRMEHLTLAYIRYQAHLGQIPTRLLPLIEGYPFRSNEQHPSSTPLLGPLPSTTRPRSVLHVKIRASTFPKTSRKPDPVFLAEQAFRATLSRGAKDSQEASRWESIRGRVQISNEDEEDGRLNLGEVFDSETIRTISIIEEMYPSRPTKAPAPPPSEPMYRPFQSNSSSDKLSSMRSLGGRPSHTRKRSMSHGDVLSSVEEFGTHPTSPSSPFSEFGMKSASHLTLSPSSSSIKPSTPGASTTGAPPSSSWAEFSSSGFGESTPTDKSSLQIGEGFDLPMPPRRLTGRSPELERILGNSSRTTLSDSAPSPTTPTSAAGRAVATSNPEEIESIEIIQVDESFFEFTQDVLLDPEVSTSFPVWAMYDLRSPIPNPSATSTLSSPTWLLISIAPKPKPVPPPSAPTTTSSSSSFLKPTASQRRSSSTPASSGDDSTINKRAKRKSFLGIGVGSLGRKKSVSAGSMLDGGRAGAVSPSPLSLSTKSSSNELKIKKPLFPVVSASVSRTKSREILVSSAPPVTVKKSVIAAPPPVPSSSEVVEISRTEPEPSFSSLIFEDTLKEEVKEETTSRPEVVASEDPVELAASPVESEVAVAPSIEPEVTLSTRTPLESTSNDQGLVQDQETSPVAFVAPSSPALPLVGPSDIAEQDSTPSLAHLDKHDEELEVLVSGTVDAPSKSILPPPSVVEDVAQLDSSPPFPSVDKADEEPSQQTIVSPTVDVPSSPTLPPSQLPQQVEPSPSLLPPGRPVEEEIPPISEAALIQGFIPDATASTDEPSSTVISPPSVVPSSRNSFETAPVAPSPPPPSTPPTIPADESFDLTISRAIAPVLDFEDPETPTGSSHVKEEEVEVEDVSSDPEAREEPRTLDEVADVVVEKVEAVVSGVAAGVMGLLQEVGVVEKEEEDGKEVVEEREVAQDSLPISTSPELNESLEAAPVVGLDQPTSEPAAFHPPSSPLQPEFEADPTLPNPTFLFTEHSDEILPGVVATKKEEEEDVPPSTIHAP